MRKAWILATLAMLGTVGTATAGPTAWGIAGFGGTSIPVAQDDNDGSGTTLGVRFPAHFGWFLSLEPHMDFNSGGSFSETFGDVEFEREGIDVKQAGVNFILGNPTRPGFRFYPFVGVGHYSMSGEGRQEMEKIGFNGGLGLGFGGSRVKFDLRGDFQMIDIGESSRKSVAATAGLGLTFNPGMD